MKQKTFKNALETKNKTTTFFLTTLSINIYEYVIVASAIESFV